MSWMSGVKLAGQLWKGVEHYLTPTQQIEVAALFVRAFEDRDCDLESLGGPIGDLANRKRYARWFDAPVSPRLGERREFDGEDFIFNGDRWVSIEVCGDPDTPAQPGDIVEVDDGVQTSYGVLLPAGEAGGQLVIKPLPGRPDPEPAAPKPKPFYYPLVVPRPHSDAGVPPLLCISEDDSGHWKLCLGGWDVKDAHTAIDLDSGCLDVIRFPLEDAAKEFWLAAVAVREGLGDVPVGSFYAEVEAARRAVDSVGFDVPAGDPLPGGGGLTAGSTWTGTIKRVAAAGKWVEVWFEEGSDRNSPEEGSDRAGSFDFCSKWGELHGLVPDQGPLWNRILTQGWRGLRLRLEWQSPNWNAVEVYAVDTEERP